MRGTGLRQPKWWFVFFLPFVPGGFYLAAALIPSFNLAFAFVGLALMLLAVLGTLWYAASPGGSAAALGFQPFLVAPLVLAARGWAAVLPFSWTMPVWSMLAFLLTLGSAAGVVGAGIARSVGHVAGKTGDLVVIALACSLLSVGGSLYLSHGMWRNRHSLPAAPCGMSRARVDG